MLNSKVLVQQLNDLNYLTEEQQNLGTSIQKTEILYQLTLLAKKPNEKEFFLMQAISLLEALCMMAFDDCNSDLQQQENTKEIDNTTFQNLQIALATNYMLLADIKQQTKFYDVAKKLLKKQVKSGNLLAIKQLIKVCALKNEPALCRFYIQKILDSNVCSKNELLEIEEIAVFSTEEWYQLLLS